MVVPTKDAAITSAGEFRLDFFAATGLVASAAAFWESVTDDTIDPLSFSYFFFNILVLFSNVL